MLKTDIAAALRAPSEDGFDQDVLLFAMRVSIWARWVIALVAAVLMIYRPEFWSLDNPERPVLLLALVLVNGLAHAWLLRGRPVTRAWLLLLNVADLALLSAAIGIGAGFDRFQFAGYYPALAMFVLVFPSVWLALAWTSLTAAACIGATLVAAGGLDFDAGDERALLGRVAAMFVLALCILLVTGLERSRRRAALQRERRLQHERIELSREVHDTIAQTAYLLEQGLRRARRLAGESNRELTAALDASCSLSTTAVWEARRLADSGRLFEGRELGTILWGHCETFERVTGVPVSFSHSGPEPPLPIETRSRLFSIAHNALTNAARHAQADRVTVSLDFEGDRVALSVADDGVGLPDDFRERGSGFRSMTADAEALGGALNVRSGNGAPGATVDCVIPLPKPEPGG